MAAKKISLFDRHIILQALGASFKKLHPLTMMRNPVMFVTEAGALITTVSLFFRSPGESIGFGIQVALWLWFTVLFANFAEAMAEGRGKAQADTLRKTRTHTIANRTLASGSSEQVPAEMLRKGDVVIIPAAPACYPIRSK
jgi:K+-transporting ATPase ATPase B chain